MSLFRFFARKLFAFAVVFCLSTALLFTGCNTDAGTGSKDDSFIPVGEWTSEWDSYTITNTTLEFVDGFGDFNGNIKEAVDFSSKAGVLLVQITTSGTEGQAGKFIGVYYKDYTASHVYLANAIDSSYVLILKNTLAEAKGTFTVDNVDTHVTHWGSGYNK